MGLDQWVYRKEYNDEFDENGELVRCHDTSVLYWRKCNQVHAWFDRLVGGVDNCEDYPVTIDDLKKLREDCQWVLDNPNVANDVMPVMKGCFFGSYEYDEDYFMDLKWTVKKLDEFLAEEHDGEEFYYHSWW